MFGLGEFLLFDVGFGVGTVGLAVALVSLGGADDRGPLSRRAAAHAGAGAAGMTPGFARLPLAIAAATLTIGLATGAAAETLQAGTVHAWNAYVAATEARIDREVRSAGRFLVADHFDDALATRDALARGTIVIAKPSTPGAGGRALDVPDGLVQHWRGAVFLPGVSLDALLDAASEPQRAGTTSAGRARAARHRPSTRPAEAGDSHDAHQDRDCHVRYRARASSTGAMALGTSPAEASARRSSKSKMRARRPNGRCPKVRIAVSCGA